MPLVTNDNESGLGERGSNLGPGGAGGTNYPTGQTNPPSSIPSSIPPDVVTFVNGTRVTNPDRNVPPETPNNIPPAPPRTAEELAELNDIDIFKWFDNPHNFDLAFIDIHNSGEKLNEVFNNDFIKDSVQNGSDVFFCGGSTLRDSINVKRREQPITSVDCDIKCVFGGETFENPQGKKSCISKIEGYK